MTARKTVLLNTTAIVLLCAYFVVTLESPTLRLVRIQQSTAFIAAISLYLSVFTKLLGQLNIGNKNINTLSNSLLVSACCFAFVHAEVSFWGLLGGLKGLQYLGSAYLVPISLGATALALIIGAAVTRVTTKKFSPKLHSTINIFLHVGAILIVIHAFMLGTHFHTSPSTAGGIALVAIAVLLCLQAYSVDKKMRTQFFLGPLTILVLIITPICIAWYFSTDNALKVGIHSTHQSQTTLPKSQYNASMNLKTTSTLHSNSEFEIEFSIFNSSSGLPATVFKKLNDHPAHLIVTDQSLTFFTHLHPRFENGKFVQRLSLPASGRYHLYLDVQPLGASEHHFGFSLTVDSPSQTKPDISNRQTSVNINSFRVNISVPQLAANQINTSGSPIRFEVTNNLNDSVGLLPYMGAYGHVVLINTETYDYYHIHPDIPVSVDSPVNKKGSIEFILSGTHRQFTPGTYRVFAQFKPGESVIVAPFTIMIE